MKANKRITLLCGHYGSGKTNVAVNLALHLRRTRPRVAVADLDIVNPYFRTKDSREEFEHAGIRLICSEYANTNVDIPALPQDMYAVTDDKDLTAVIDVGGDDRGALALGRITESILRENDYEMLAVINASRPLTRTAADTVEVLREIEAASGMKFTGLVNNTNLGRQTDAEVVLKSVSYAESVSNQMQIPVVLTTVPVEIFPQLQGKIDNLFPLELQKKL
jgi:hypothetical protein